MREGWGGNIKPDKDDIDAGSAFMGDVGTTFLEAWGGIK
jgi:hypothetical protein